MPAGICTLDVLGRGLYFDDVAARADIVVTWWRTRHHVHRDHHSHRNTCHNVARLDDQFCYSATETNRKTLQTRIDNFYQNELPFRKTITHWSCVRGRRVAHRSVVSMWSWAVCVLAASLVSLRVKTFGVAASSAAHAAAATATAAPLHE